MVWQGYGIVWYVVQYFFVRYWDGVVRYGLVYKACGQRQRQTDLAFPKYLFFELRTTANPFSLLRVNRCES